LTGHEAISSLFRLDVELYSESLAIDFNALVGKGVSLRLLLADGSERFFHGVISRFGQGDPRGPFVRYRAEIVPWLWFLTRSANCRIFQDKSVPKIIEKVFKDLGQNDYQLKLSKTYEDRHYCVQYRETDFNFVSRLMEEEGIAYYFEHGEKEHILVLFDTPDGNAECALQKEATYTSAVGLETRSAAAAAEIEEWHLQQELSTGRYAINDFNFESPGTPMLATTNSSISIGGNERFEVYDYPGEYEEFGWGEVRVKRRMEAEESAAIAVRAQSGCGAFSPGYHFKLVGHYAKDANVKYLITQVTHRIYQSIGDEAEGTARYSNSFGCIPYSVPYRPPQNTPKPIITGVQTATVVGAAGEEIDVDKHGRVVVQFHWDREGKRDENSSCRVRVAQNWAGANWGMVFHPRIGHEVIVEFLEGDPDRPIITGRVYNGMHMPPYALPANKTQSGVKSRTSPGGDKETFNEIRMEDQNGQELFYIHAEKDRQKIVENDEAEEVHHDRERSVGNDETVSIGHDRTVTVSNDHKEKVGGNEKLEVTGDREREVLGLEKVMVSKDQTIVISANRNVEVAKDQIIGVKGDQGESVEGKYDMVVDGNYTQTVKSKISIDAADQIVLTSGSAEVTMKKNGDITVKGKKITIKGSGDVVIKGSKVSLN